MLSKSESWYARCVTVVVALLLLWTTHECLTAPLLRGRLELQELTLEAASPRDKHPDATAAETWVNEIIIDGHGPLPDSLRWKGIWTTDYGWRVHRGDEPASVAFTGRSAVVELMRSTWTGTATVLDSSGRTPVDTYSEVQGSRFVDLPAWTEPAWSWLIFALPIGALVFVTRPWRSRRRLEVWCWLGFIVTHATIVSTMPIETTSDSLHYLGSLVSTVELGQPSYFPCGYGLVLALATALAPEGVGIATVVLQHLMMAVTMFMLWQLARTAMPWWLAVAWLVLTSWLVPTLILPQTLLSENLSLMCLVAAVHCSWRAIGSGSKLFAIMAGLGLGVATITRVTPLGVSGPAMWLLFLSSGTAAGADPATPAKGWFRKLVNTLVPSGRSRALAWCAFGTAAVVILAPMLAHAARGNSFALSDGAGRHLFNRVVYEQKQIDTNGPATREMQALMPGVDLTTQCHWDVAAKLHALEWGRMQALISAVAKEALVLDPIAFVLFTFPLTWRNFTADPCSYLLHIGRLSSPLEIAVEAEPCLGYSAAAGAWAESLAAAFAPIWVVCCWACVAAALVWWWMPHRWLALAMLWSVWSYMFASSAVEFYLTRYNAGVTPICVWVAFLPLAAACRAFKALIPAARSELPSPA